MFWLIFLNRAALPHQVPLFYFEPWGLEQLGSATQLWLIPACCGGVFVLNTILAWRFFHREKLLAQILMSGTAITSLLGLIFLIRILSLVTV